LNLREAKHRLAEEKLYAQIEELLIRNESLKSEVEYYKAQANTGGNGFDVSIRNKQYWKTTEEECDMSPVKHELKTQDGKCQRIFEDGHKETIFPNGVRKEVYPNGYQVVQFVNGDVKQDFADGKVVYTFSQSKTV
jgi:hypothetical protein